MTDWDVKIVPETTIAPEDEGDLVDNRPNRSQFYSRLWMFSPITGQFMDFNNREHVLECPLTGVTRSYSLINGFAVKRDSKWERVRKEHQLDPLVKDYEEWDTAPNFKRATIEERCEKCGHEKMEYFTMQLRSADEGQTVFFECPKCGHKWRTNN